MFPSTRLMGHSNTESNTFISDAFSKPLDTKWTLGVKLRPSFGEASASADFGGYALN